MWIVLLVIGIVGFVISKLFKESKETINVQGKSVFITGCDTGFGHGIAIRMDQLGMKVFAGCITEKGMEELRKSCSPNIHPLLCDITQADQIENAVKTISDACPDGLWGLVNNAGILVIGEWDWTCEQSLRKVMDVNFFGHVAITRAFLPLLKKSKGRIVNMTSLAGIVAISKLGAYSCAKFAMEAFSDSLRREMRKWGISVFIIEPGFSDTPMIAGLNSLLQQTWEEASETKKKEYGEEYGKLATEFKIRQLDPLNLVIDAFQDTLTLKYPKARARVGILAAIFYSLHTVLPTTWWDYLLEIDNRNLIPITVSKPTING